MGTLSALLNLSRGALDASQAALGISSNNVANANTPGYTQQIAIWQQNDTVSIGHNTGIGEGASVTGISRRDRVLNQAVQQQTQSESFSSAQSAALNQLQTIFGITTNAKLPVSTTLGSDINSLFSSLNALQASPSSSSVRQAAISAAGTLASDFNGASNQIQQQTTSLNHQVLDTLSQVNALTKSIASLNLQIESSSPTSDAGTLEDQRQQNLAQLSQFIGFNQTRTENNGLTLATANGAPLVSGGQSYPLSSTSANGNTSVISALGQDLTNSLTGGSIGGMLQARDHDLPHVSSAIDALAYGLAFAVNTQNQAGLDANGNPGGVIFNISATAAGAASTISLATSNPNAIAAASLAEGLTGGTNAIALSSLANAALVNGQTASQFYASMLTQLGSTVSQVSDDNVTQQASLTQLTTQQHALSSVSLDQEAATLTQYERSYSAAARVFTIVDQLMASALNLGMATTVS